MSLEYSTGVSDGRRQGRIEALEAFLEWLNEDYQGSWETRYLVKEIERRIRFDKEEES